MRFTQAFEATKRELKYQGMGNCSKNKIGPLHIPFIMAGVGIGKTDLAKLIAIHTALPHAHINAGEASDGTDMTGVPFPVHFNNEDWITTWAPNDIMYHATKEPMLLHFDDVDKARPPAQNALIGLLGERRFRDTKLHPGTLVILTGNRVEDDMYAQQISESVRTRATIILLDPSAQEFSKWGEDTGLIHPLFRGYVMFKPDHLHVISKTGERHTTPRGYREASDQLLNEPESVWREIMELKLGAAVANDCWAYHTIYSQVDVAHVMQHGTAKAPPHSPTSFDPDNVAHVRRFNYAAIFAVSHALNDGTFTVGKNTTPGIATFITKMEVEMRVAFLVQLNTKVRATLSHAFKKESALLTDALVN